MSTTDKFTTAARRTLAEITRVAESLARNPSAVRTAIAALRDLVELFRAARREK